MSNLWIEVDLDAVKHNYYQVLSLLTPETKLMAVVKADAYGLGAVEVARVLQEEGCTSFAVTAVDEALILRSQGITGEVLVLGPTSEEDWKAALGENIQLTVAQVEWLHAIDDIAAAMGKKAVVHLKLETGMGRTGFTEDKLAALSCVLRETEYIEVAGAYTHLARGAQRDTSYTRGQHEKFMRLLKKFEESGVTIPAKHICNSAAFLDFPEYHYDYVRVGTLLGGHYPSSIFDRKLDLKDPWKVKARITHLQKVPKGTYVGYQSLYKSKTDTMLAVVPAGYAHGFGIEPKLVPQGILDLVKIIIKNTAALFGFQLGREKILYKGNPVSIAGKVGMQLTVLDLGTVDCKYGEEIVLPIRRTLANPRITRIYKKNNEFYKKRIIREGFFEINTEYSNTEV
ncbi:MAG: Alanine racemase 1 [Candidatus Dichloromethanomonas elyunquensis]|nr:MAG: Alanine racemase 1 [Candidatus Dichloromethanomonas elyunquensis]